MKKNINICFIFIIIFLLYKVFYISNKKNCYLYEYFNEITDIAINKQYDIFIIYYGFINPNNNWKDIIIGQFTDIKDSKIIFNNFHNVRLEIVLSSNSKDIMDEAVTITNDFFKNISYNKYNIITINDNLYEYPGILHLYKKGVDNPNALLFYLHSKGMAFHNNLGRIPSEIKLTRYTLFKWKKIINIFNNNNNINKVTIACSNHGWGWFNFFWVRGSYFQGCKEPIISNDRYYYESWLGFNCSNTYKDCYNLINPEKHFYEPIEASELINNLELINNNDSD